ncbi:MAG: filamentous hemagglutinin N-terminal domain-containing protein, partial [Opitutaceae bacterium]
MPVVGLRQSNGAQKGHRPVRRSAFSVQRSAFDVGSWVLRARPSGLRPFVLAVLVLLSASRMAEANSILREHGSAASPAAVAAASGGVGGSSGTSSPGVAAAQTALARATNAVMAVQHMQNLAAQALAGSYLTPRTGLFAGQALPPVADGLVDNTLSGGAGGLIPAGGVPVQTTPGAYDLSSLLQSGAWAGVSSLTQASSNNQTTVTVIQTAEHAFLNWQTFNIGPNTTLNFNQSLGGTDVTNWIAFNKVSDPSARPSQILGRINALGPDGTPNTGGQVYIINPNGVIFGGSSQVNTHALVVSSLPINDNRTGIVLNNPDSQFLFSALPTGTAGGSIPPFNPSNASGDAVPANGYLGDVEVQPGAQLNAVPTADNSGGLVALIGPNVYNAGVIKTPFGQTILAAGLQVDLVAHDSSDPSLRGLDAY